MSGKEVDTMQLSDTIFGAEINPDLLHSAVKTYLSNQRQGTQSTLTRTEVSGGGKKPWRQKGTGRARQGSTRAPQWTHGGVALGPKPRSYRLAFNKSAKRVALYSALSAKVAENKFVVVNEIVADSYKTKVMADMLSALNCDKRVLVVLAGQNDFAVKSCANIPAVETTTLYKDADEVAHANINVYEILKADAIVIAKDAVAMLEEVYA